MWKDLIKYLGLAFRREMGAGDAELETDRISVNAETIMSE